MTHLPPFPDSTGDSDSTEDSAPPHGTPGRGVLVGTAIAIGLLILMVALHLSGTLGPGTH